MKPVVSIITPCCNSGSFLLVAEDSLHKNCSIPFEIIITDDGSMNLHTLAILKRGVRILSQENCGPTVARNEAVLLATADILLFWIVVTRSRLAMWRKALRFIRRSHSWELWMTRIGMINLVLEIKPYFEKLHAINGAISRRRHNEGSRTTGGKEIYFHQEGIPVFIGRKNVLLNE